MRENAVAGSATPDDMATASADNVPDRDPAAARQRVRLERTRGRMRSAHWLALLYLLFASSLIALRAIYNDRFGFFGMPWILALALVPLIPWFVPILSPWMKRVAPYVQSVKLGTLEVQLRESEPQVGSLGSVATMLTDPTVQPLRAAGQEDFYTTHAQMILAGMQAIHAQGAEVVIVDLEAGAKWRYPNLYFLVRLLEADPHVLHMVFTESRGGEGGTLSRCALRTSYAHASRPPSRPMQMRAPYCRFRPI
jgi:hypothetical protein